MSAEEQATTSRIVLYMSMSLDGFIAGPGDTVDEPFGRGGQRLHAWLGPVVQHEERGVPDFRPEGPSQVVFDEIMATGAVILGRRLGEFVDYWGGNHHDGVPMFVPTHQEPAENPHERVHFVTEGIAEAARLAKAAAGGRDVMMHGAYTGREALEAGVLDVIEIQLVPVLLGQGRLLFDGLPEEQVELDLVRTIEAPDALHLRYEVRR